MYDAGPTGVTHNKHFNFDRSLLLCQRNVTRSRDARPHPTCGGFQTPRQCLSGKPRTKATSTLIGSNFVRFDRVSRALARQV